MYIDCKRFDNMRCDLCHCLKVLRHNINMEGASMEGECKDCANTVA
jgi:hypothetical protein